MIIYGLSRANNSMQFYLQITAENGNTVFKVDMLTADPHWKVVVVVVIVVVVVAVVVVVVV